MFETITGRLSAAFARLTSRGKLSAADVEEGLREVRVALLEADVHYKVVKDFVARVKEKAVGQDVLSAIRPGQQVVKIVHDELVALMGTGDSTLARAQEGPTVVMLAGLQGSGKTTTAAKLAYLLQRQGRKPLLVAADVQRPAAVQQLKVLGAEIGVPVHAEERTRPPVICENGVKEAAKTGLDCVILDTAGRLHIDQALMEELKEVVRRTSPHEVLYVADAMTGQDAVTSAKAFDEALPITGVILTKLDGDARGGAALSVRAVTGKPIKFAGVGEKVDRLEVFHPERMAERVLGMGDVVSLVEKAQEVVDQEKAARFQEKLLDASFDLGDFLEQLRQVKKMGPLKDIMSMIPGFKAAMGDAEVDDNELVAIEAMICSMTPEERRNPDVIDGRRRRRIALGSGRNPGEVNDLLRQFGQLRKMMKEVKRMQSGGRMKMPFGRFKR